MASQKQTNANRVNALRSTGPRTSEGKSRSRLNAVKHGLTAEMIIIGDEDPREFEQLRASLTEQHDPQGPDERELVEYLAGVFWRLRRIPLFEAAIFAARHAQVAEQIREEEARVRYLDDNDEDATQEGDAETNQPLSDAMWLIEIGRTLIKDGIWHDALGKLARHEATQFNSLRRTLILLEEMRERRLKNPVTLRALPLPSAA